MVECKDSFICKMEEKIQTKTALLQEAKDRILWSLFLKEDEKQELLAKVVDFDEQALIKLIAALDKAKNRENKVFDLMGQIDANTPEKIKEIRQKNTQKMYESAEKSESSKEKAEEILKKI